MEPEVKPGQIWKWTGYKRVDKPALTMTAFYRVLSVDKKQVRLVRVDKETFQKRESNSFKYYKESLILYPRMWTLHLNNSEPPIDIEIPDTGDVIEI